MIYEMKCTRCGGNCTEYDTDKWICLECQLKFVYKKPLDPINNEIFIKNEKIDIDGNTTYKCNECLKVFSTVTNPQQKCVNCNKILNICQNCFGVNIKNSLCLNCYTEYLKKEQISQESKTEEFWTIFFTIVFLFFAFGFLSIVLDSCNQSCENRLIRLENERIELELEKQKELEKEEKIRLEKEFKIQEEKRIELEKQKELEKIEKDIFVEKSEYDKYKRRCSYPWVTEEDLKNFDISRKKYEELKDKLKKLKK